MFFALFRLILILLVFATIAYVSLWFYARSLQREKLERRWENEGRPGALDTYVRDGLESERMSLHRRLLLGVYIVPFALVGIVIYFANFS